jgi:hypothetical protein
MKDYRERDFRVSGALTTSFHPLLIFSMAFSEVDSVHGREYTVGPTSGTISKFVFLMRHSVKNGRLRSRGLSDVTGVTVQEWSPVMKKRSAGPVTVAGRCRDLRGSFVSVPHALIVVVKVK